MEPKQPTPAPSPKMPKYKLKLRGEAKSIVYPGFRGVEYTQSHIDGPHGDTIIAAFKKMDKKMKQDNFSKFVEEVK